MFDNGGQTNGVEIFQEKGKYQINAFPVFIQHKIAYFTRINEDAITTIILLLTTAMRIWLTLL